MDTGIEGNTANRGGSFLAGFLTGGAVAGLAIYFAPRLASELRRRLTDSTTGLRNAAQGVATRVADVVDRVADVADDVTRRGQAARDGVADVVARGAHGVGRGAREVVRGAREVEQFAKASKTDHTAA